MIRPTPNQAYAKRLAPRRPLELLPASLLPYRKTWQPLVRSLPKNAYLIVTNLDQELVNESMLQLVRSLRRQGQLVYILSVGQCLAAPQNSKEAWT